ncbi:glyoxalase superfamily protein [Actinospica robiniae]|uniref:glyoxalase superfamily protein n=1 Tax=Actinospica robiniae TaxID=304901 RepID=UPI00042087FD|nr:glyoxalase superfamily protein [Actinospica robiniae]
MTSTNTDLAKKLAKRLRDDLAAAGTEIPHSLALELIAHQLAAKDWNVLSAALAKTGAAADAGADSDADAEMRPGVPILRVMDMALALPFYLDYLGFTLDWEHRFEPGLPVYAQVSRSATVLHLSEHHGDGSPNGVVWIPVRDVTALQRELLAKDDTRLRPGVHADAPGGPTMQVIDPYGNVLRFAQPPRV